MISKSFHAMSCFALCQESGVRFSILSDVWGNVGGV